MHCGWGFELKYKHSKEVGIHLGKNKLNAHHQLFKNI
jgi:hypothetical protein